MIISLLIISLLIISLLMIILLILISISLDCVLIWLGEDWFWETSDVVVLGFLCSENPAFRKLFVSPTYEASHVSHCMSFIGPTTSSFWILSLGRTDNCNTWCIITNEICAGWGLLPYMAYTGMCRWAEQGKIIFPRVCPNYKLDEISLYSKYTRPLITTWIFCIAIANKWF